MHKICVKRSDKLQIWREFAIIVVLCSGSTSLKKYFVIFIANMKMFTRHCLVFSECLFLRRPWSNKIVYSILYIRQGTWSWLYFRVGAHLYEISVLKCSCSACPITFLHVVPLLESASLLSPNYVFAQALILLCNFCVMYMIFCHTFYISYVAGES